MNAISIIVVVVGVVVVVVAAAAAAAAAAVVINHLQSSEMHKRVSRQWCVLLAVMRRVFLSKEVSATSLKDNFACSSSIKHSLFSSPFQMVMLCVCLAVVDKGNGKNLFQC